MESSGLGRETFFPNFSTFFLAQFFKCVKFNELDFFENFTSSD